MAKFMTQDNEDPSKVELITLDAKNIGQVRQFCGLSPKYAKAYTGKSHWLKKRIDEGMRYTLLRVRGINAGMIEYLPGEYVWRGVDARGYLFIHCFWVIGSNRKHGYGRQLLDACIADAMKNNFDGVAVMTSTNHWLPTRKIFIKNGFELVDTAPPSFELLVKRFNPAASFPRFIQHDINSVQIPSGLALFTSSQCPYFCVNEQIVRDVAEQLRMPVSINYIENSTQAQRSPCLYGTMGIFFNGQLISYQPVGTKELIKTIQSTPIK